MKMMSFMLTTKQVADKTKTVTRRVGWSTLKPGDLIQPVVQCQGLKKGEKIEKIGGPIRIVSVRREKLIAIDYEDCKREGFPDLTPKEFCSLFARANKGIPISAEVNRVEFEYT